MNNVPHVLNSDDSAQAVALARHIHACAEPLNRQVIARYGMDIFQQVKSTETLTQDVVYILYHVPEFITCVAPFFENYARLTAFERAVALNVHLLCTNQPLTVLVFEVQS